MYCMMRAKRGIYLYMIRWCFKLYSSLLKCIYSYFFLTGTNTMCWGSLHRCRSTPVSTVLWKLVRFFIIYIFLIIKKTFQVEILSEWLGNPGKGTLRSKNLKNFLREPAPDPARSLRLCRSFRKSVSIYPRSAPAASISYWVMCFRFV